MLWFLLRVGYVLPAGFIVLLATIIACGGSAAVPASTQVLTAAAPTAVPDPTPTAEPPAAPTAPPDPTPTAEPPAAPTAPPESTSTPVPTPTSVVYEFDDDGDRVVGPFHLVQGLAVISASHGGGANFIVWTQGEGGQRELSFNAIGRYGGTTAHQVSSSRSLALEPGEHFMEVSADGPWEIAVSQEFPASAPALSFQTNGRGDDVIRWVALEEGRKKMTATHTGNANFIIELLAADGGEWDLLVNEIGNYQGEKLINVGSGVLDASPGIYAIAVTADGDWSIEIE